MAASTRPGHGLMVALACLLVACTSPTAYAASVAKTETAHADAATLDALRRAGDRAGQRRHAWSLFARLIASADAASPPTFERWYTEDETFAPSTAPEPQVMAALRVKSASQPAAAPQPAAAWPRFVATSPVAGIAPTPGGPDPADAPVLAYTLYNAAAYRHIRTLRLYDAAELDRLRSAGAPDTVAARNRTVAPFPTDAVVIKTAWWPVAQDRLTAMPVWDPARNPPRKGGNAYPVWSRVVAIDPARRTDSGTVAIVAADSRAAGFTPIDFAGRSFAAARRVPLARIPHVTLDARAAAALRGVPSARKALLLALGRDVRAGDSLALVAVHVATREVADWIWATAWWHDEPERGPFAADRPAALRGAWRQFLLDVAFDEVAPAESDGSPHIAFNPWLEARFPDGGHGGGTASNCLTCHRRASWPVTSFLPVTRGAPDSAHDPAYAPGRLRTQFLWSIALRARRTQGAHETRGP